MAGIRHWILDGYNVMHALNFLSDNLPFEIARERFISWLGQFETLGDKHVTVVFDDNIHEGGPREINRVHTLYSPQGFNGDGTVLGIVRATPSKLRHTLTIVTRDLMLRDAIFAYRCVVISPESFKQEFESYRAYADRKGSTLDAARSHFSQPFKDLL